MEGVSDYFEDLLHHINNSHWVIHEELTFRQIDIDAGYIKGSLYLHGGCTLHVAEYIEIQTDHLIRLKYRYQLQDYAQALIARWDNALHHKEIETTPYHKHCQNEDIVASPAMDILKVLAELDEVLKDVRP